MRAFEKQSGVEARAQIITFMHAFATEHGEAPSVAEIARAVHIVANGVRGHLRLLEQRGYVKHRNRRWQLVAPVNGVAAGAATQPAPSGG